MMTSSSNNLFSHSAVERTWHMQDSQGQILASLLYSGVTLNVARPDMNNYATLGVMLY